MLAFSTARLVNTDSVYCVTELMLRSIEVMKS